jgi:hypothetical protein
MWFASVKEVSVVAQRNCIAALRRAFESVGIDFIDENGGGPGVRLRERQWARQAK